MDKVLLLCIIYFTLGFYVRNIFTAPIEYTNEIISNEILFDPCIEIELFLLKLKIRMSNEKIQNRTNFRKLLNKYFQLTSECWKVVPLRIKKSIFNL